MIRLKSPNLYLFFYIMFSLTAWMLQSGIDYKIGYGFCILLLSYLYFFLGLYLGKAAKILEFPRYPKKIINIRKFIKILLFIDVFIIIDLVISFLGIINQGGSLLQYRASIFIGDTIKTYYGQYAAYLFIYATLIPLLGISYGLYSKIVKDRKLILLFSFLLLFLKEGILFSRYYAYAAVFSAILLLFCYDKKMTYKKIILTLLSFATAMIVIFSLRGGEGGLSNITNAFNYLVAGYSLFTNSIDSNDILAFANLSSPLSFLGAVGAKLYDSVPFFEKVQQFVLLGNAGYFNAFYTALLLPYVCYGATGLMIISLLFGVFISIFNKLFFVRKKFTSFNSLFSLLLIFFSHQFLPVQMSFFWEYMMLSLSLQTIVIVLRMELE